MKKKEKKKKEYSINFAGYIYLFISICLTLYCNCYKILQRLLRLTNGLDIP